MGLGPWYGLWPMNIGGKARTTGTARHDSLATGEAKPRRTSGGGAASKGLLRQSPPQHTVGTHLLKFPKRHEPTICNEKDLGSLKTRNPSSLPAMSSRLKPDAIFTLLGFVDFQEPSAEFVAVEFLNRRCAFLLR